ncbi:hypothetical protein ABEB36_007898 [Hypothenemus hampei]
MERNDTIRLRELYMKYSGKKPIERIPSPATFETPLDIHHSQDDIPLDNPEIVEESSHEESKSKLSLDQYLNSHTSQDNESFEDIIEKSEQKHREKYKYLFSVQDSSETNMMKMMALPSIEQQAALPEKPFIVNTWSYKNKNTLMYNPDGVKLTNEDELKKIKERHIIVHENTRLKLNPFNETQSKETISELAKNQAKVLDGKIGVDGKELLKPETPKIGGFSLVRTPSPSPSILGTPLMTWGEIEGTPFRLDGSDSPVPHRSQGPAFKMAEPPRREQIAFALAEKVSEKKRNRKNSMEARYSTTPSPGRPNSSAIDRLATMSPAARKLAASHLKISTAFSPSSRSSLVSPSPKRLSTTPKRITTPKLNLGIKKAGEAPKEVSTDDLLKISVPNRKKASDFFYYSNDT